MYASLVNYFQLPAGTGEDLSFDFDISDFVKKFKLDTLTTNNVLKILEQEELISYSDQFFTPSIVVFTCDKTEMDLFEKTYPQYDPVIKGLLRSYEGIFDYPSAINEKHLATFISMKKEQLVADLIEIKKMGIIDYTPQKENPQIKFLQNRVSTSRSCYQSKKHFKKKR